MDFSVAMSLCVDIVEYCIPFVVIFGITAKILNFAFDMMFNKKIDL